MWGRKDGCGEIWSPIRPKETRRDVKKRLELASQPLRPPRRGERLSRRAVHYGTVPCVVTIERGTETALQTAESGAVRNGTLGVGPESHRNQVGRSR